MTRKTVDGGPPPPPAPKGFTLEIEEVHVDGDLEIGWAKGKSPGTADLKFALRTKIETITRAEYLEEILPGATCVFHHAGDAQEADPEAAGGFKYNGHAQRTGFDSGLSWVVCELGEAGPLDGNGLAKLEGDAPMRSVTLTASSGVATLTVGWKLTVPIGQLPAVVALDGKRCLARARVIQGGLPFEGGSDDDGDELPEEP